MKPAHWLIWLGWAVSPLVAAEPPERATLDGHRGHVRELAFNSDGKTLASLAQDGVIKLWNAVTARNTATLEARAGELHSMAFSPDGKLLASVGENGTITLWDVNL